MYAVIQTGGKQYKVCENDFVKVEKLNLEVGDKVEFEALMVGEGENVTVGTPVVEGSKVVCEVLRQDKAKKIIVFKFKAKKNIRKKQGHRQSFTELKVLSISQKA